MLNDTVTLYCRFGPARAEAFQRTVLSGVRFDPAAAANARAGTARSADRAVLFIPFSAARHYVSPQAWQKLDAGARKNLWTLQAGDVVFPGAVPDTGKSPSAVMAESKSGFVITTVDEKRADSPLAHFAVGCGRLYRQGGGVS